MLIRMVAQTVLTLAVFGAVLLAAAGDPFWPEAWMLVGEVLLLTLATNAWLMRHDPSLLAQRMGSSKQRHQKRWDRFYLPASSAAFVAWVVLLGLDARRLHWSRMPQTVEIAGALLIGLGLLLVWLTFRHNSFAVPQVRMQIERNHRVVSDGPYRFVRHPMYSGSILVFAGMPLLLGSWWGLLFVPLQVGVLALRTIGEERMLSAELPGYADYRARTRYRLVPGLL